MRDRDRKTILVLNMGMKSIRSILFYSTGERISDYALPLQTILSGTTVTQDPEEWWEKAIQVIRESMGMLPGLTIDYITVTTSSSCLVCVDRNGKSLYPCMMVSDKRACEESGELSQCEEFGKAWRETGLKMDVSLMLPKILWMKKHQENIFCNTSMFLSPNDYLTYKLSGVYVTDYFNAQKYHFSMKSYRYPEELLHRIGIGEDRLPRVQAPGTVVGTVSEEGIKIGLPPQCKVILSTYDAICSFIGSGAEREGEASDVSGTVTVFRALTRRDSLAPSDKVYELSYPDEKCRIVGGSNNLGGGLIEWVKQCYYQKDSYPYELMEKEAGEVAVGSKGVIFLPYLLGERAPLWNTDARGVYFGLERMHTRREMTRAVFESTGFIDLGMMEAIEETGVKVSGIRVSGGLARINLISQIKADITGKEIIVLSDFETTSIGAAMIALCGARVYSGRGEAAERFVKVRMIIRPDETNHEKYQKIYQLYQDAYRTMKPLFAKRMQLVDELYGNRMIKVENL